MTCASPALPDPLAVCPKAVFLEIQLCPLSESIIHRARNIANLPAGGSRAGFIAGAPLSVYTINLNFLAWPALLSWSVVLLFSSC